MADVVQIILALQNVRQFVSGADRASTSITKVGSAAEKSGQQAKVGWKGIAKWGGAAAAVYGATRFIKGAVSTTEELGKATLTLNRTTGMDIKTSSEWAAVMKVRGVNVRTAQMGLTAFAKQIERTRIGTKKHNSALEQLGISSKDAAVQSGNVNNLLARVAQRFSQMRNPAKRAALAQTLFSRAGRDLQPILFKGRKAIEESLAMADKYGASLSGKNAEAIKEEIAHQRELRMAYLGVQVRLGTALLPIMLAVTQVLVKLTDAVQPLLKNSLALKIVIVTLTIAFVAYKIAMIAATIAEIGFNVATLITLGWILLVIAAVALLAVGVYMLIKHWDWVKKKAMDVWGWIKKNWPLLLPILLGPFGIALALIIKNWGTIKKATKALVDFAITQFQRLIDFVKSIPGKIGGVFKKIPGAGLVRRAGGHIPFTQFGGHVQRTGSVLVGEAGPELLTMPGGATVTPLAAGGFPGGSPLGPLVVKTQLVVDRKVLAEAVATHAADKLARR